MMENEKRLIDANAVQDKIDHEMDVCNSGLIRGELKFLKGLVNTIPTVDAVEVVHGRWRYEGLNAVCSNCGFKWFEGCQECGVCPSDVNYCPHCGAKMDLEVK